MEQFIRDPEEALYVKNYDSSKYKKPGVTADMAIFSGDKENLRLLMVRRKNHPFRGFFALPGGFSEEGESLDETAARELFEETHVKGVRLEQLATFSAPGRDPRGWTITGAYLALVRAEDVTVEAGDDAKEARWFSVDFKKTRISGEDGGEEKYLCDLVMLSGDTRLSAKAEAVIPFRGALPRLKVLSSEGLAFDHPDIVITALFRVEAWL